MGERRAGVSSGVCAQPISNPGTKIIFKNGALMCGTAHRRVARRFTIAHTERCLERVAAIPILVGMWQDIDLIIHCAEHGAYNRSNRT